MLRHICHFLQALKPGYYVHNANSSYFTLQAWFICKYNPPISSVTSWHGFNKSGLFNLLARQVSVPWQSTMCSIIHSLLTASLFYSQSLIHYAFLGLWNDFDGINGKVGSFYTSKSCVCHFLTSYLFFSVCSLHILINAR